MLENERLKNMNCIPCQDPKTEKAHSWNFDKTAWPMTTASESETEYTDSSYKKTLIAIMLTH